MELVNYLAELWGILLVVMAIALLIKPRYISMLFEKIQDDKNLFCHGVASLVIGLAMVLSYNVWVKNWTIIITLFGWAALLKGLFMLFLPERAKALLEKMSRSAYIQYALLVMLVIGLILIYYTFAV
jgi:uncharacterized protein YjeT (DUF2065 family)